MADDVVNEDQWLYGDSSNDIDKDKTLEESNSATDDHDKREGEENEENVALNGKDVPENVPGDLEEGQLSAEEDQQDTAPDTEAGEAGDDQDDESDDDVQVTIGDIKTNPTYTSLNIKRGTLSAAVDKSKTGKFSIDEFEAVGSINGVPAHEFNLDSLEDKPWRKPGADITDYFNYGFNEETWRAYCERQKRVRIHESGVGVSALSGAIKQGVIPVAIVNDNSKYSGSAGPKKAGPPPGRKLAGTIDVIGTGSLSSRRGSEKTPPKENVIQVMTGDRREYSKKPFVDVSVPPPGIPPFDMPPPPPGSGIIPPVGGFPGPPGTFHGEYYNPESDPYYHSYEPTQESQWDNQMWEAPPPPPAGADTVTSVVTSVSEASNQDSQDAVSTRDSVTTERTEEKEERHSSRSHRRRSRSRSTERRRRHKSRSKSPSHRHRRKKSRREKEESE